jgi:CitMHS family citrate-Mg2+:H+ or citrate-Ca2+:H+ symporter
MLILYNAVGMKPTTLATIVALGAGTMNAVPWSAVPLRAATILSTPARDVSSVEIVGGIMVPLGAGLLLVVGIAFFLGLRERKAIGYSPNATAALQLEKIEGVLELSEEQAKLLRPKMIPVNVCMIIVTVVILMTGFAPPHITFMVAFSIALVLNFPVVATQRARIDAHAKSALMMASVLFGAAVLIGITRNSGMIEAMTQVAVNIIPDAMGRYIPVIVGVLAMPMSLLFDPDSFYFGVLPVLVQTAEGFGVEGINVVRAALLGQMTTGFPVSPLTPATFLLVGLAGVDFGEHQKRTIPFAFAVTIFMLIVSLITGAIRI